MQFLNNSFFKRTFWTLVPFVALVTILYSVLIVSAIKTTEDYVVKQYLTREFEQFATHHVNKGGKAFLPRTSYLRSYWADDPELPPEYQGLPTGRHVSLDDRFQILVDRPAEDERLLFMVLDETRFTTLERLEVPLLVVISLIAAVVVLLGGLLAAIIARRLTSPVVGLAQDALAPWNPSMRFSGSERSDEIGTLSRALTSLLSRLTNALEREKSFTRHASHEMRTPITVISNSAALLKVPGVAEEKRTRGLHRIRQSCDELQSLMEVFLCLGREDSNLPSESIKVADLVELLLLKYAITLSAKSMSVQRDIPPEEIIEAPRQLLTVLLDNMLRNAISHGVDSIYIKIDQRGIEVKNTLASSPASSQYGYGLEICRRVSEQMNWMFHTTKESNAYQSIVYFGDN